MEDERTATVVDSTTTETVAETETETATTSLEEIIEAFECTSGTLHRLDDGRLQLVSSVGIPESVRTRIETIPIGKGMAGIAAERMEPVDVCNLQTDDSGVAEDGARETGMEGSLAAPIVGPEGTLEGTIGIAKPEPYEFTPEERERLMETAPRLDTQL